MAEVGRSGPQRERDPLARGLGLAGAGHLAVAADHDSTRRAGRLDGRLDDHAQQLPRIVSRDQRLAESLRGVTHARPLGLDVETLLLELRRHVVERPSEVRELITSANLDTLAEVATGDRVRRDGELAQRPDDRLAEQVGDRTEQDERAEQRCADALLGVSRARVERALRRECCERQALRIGERHGGETPVRRAGELDAPGDSRAKRKARARSDAGDDRARSDRDELVAGRKARAEPRQQRMRRSRTRIGDASDDSTAADHGHGSHPGR